MTSNYNRYLGPLLSKSKPKVENQLLRADLSKKDKPYTIPPEFNGKDYVSFLLHIDAELEHGLMLQYLYAAYSLGGDQVPENQRDLVREWQEVILGIAKEEMGHFISVQNILRLIGAPLNFGRQDYPWDTPFYPFPFKLEPLTLESLAKYVYAESPDGWVYSNKPYAAEVKALIGIGDPDSEIHDPVSVLFAELIALVKDPEVLSDDVFQSRTYAYQAKFDEWGRGYKGGERGNTSVEHFKNAPDVLVAPLASRDDAVASLNEIGEQGEATSLEKNGDLPSHFERFLHIFAEWSDLEKKGMDWSPTRNIATNPYIGWNQEDPDFAPAEGLISNQEQDEITEPETILWGHLFNTRYRMLLVFLNHSFLLDDGFNNSGAFSPRGTIINATFGEMYNLRGIAKVMVQLPLGANSDKKAGPPFLLPYTLNLPTDEYDRWRMHQDILDASAQLIEQLLAYPNQQYTRYLYSLREADQKLMDIIKQLTASPVA